MKIKVSGARCRSREGGASQKAATVPHSSSLVDRLVAACTRASKVETGEFEVALCYLTPSTSHLTPKL